jgi:hypothetical protein
MELARRNTGYRFLSSASWCAEARGTISLQLHWISRPLQPGGAPKFVKTRGVGQY